MARRRSGKKAAETRKASPPPSQRRTRVYRDELHQSIRRCLPRHGLPLQVKDKRVSWTPRILATCAILWVWNEAASLKDRWADARLASIQIYDSRKRPGQSYAGFISALCSGSEQLTQLLCQTLRALVQEIAGDYWTVEGWAVFGADGTKVQCPMTDANEQAFGSAGKANAMPQQFLTILLHLGTGLPWAFERGPAASSERDHLRQMIGLLPAGSLLVADAGFTGYDLLGSIMQAGHSFVIRVGSNVRLLRKLGYAVRECDDLVYLWPDARQKKKQPPLVLRLVVLHEGRHPVYLLSNVLEEEKLSTATMAKVYKMRWGLELYYRTLKQTMGKRKLLSDSPQAARVELDWSVIGLWMLGVMTVEALIAQGRSPGQCSAASALRVVRQASARMNSRCRAGALPCALRQAIKDGYQRQTSKTARHYPRKKTERPPGQPKIRMADETEVQLAQQLMRNYHAKKLAA